MKGKKVPPYEEEIMKKTEIGNYRTYEYKLPFNYENINVVRCLKGSEGHGMEMNPINSFATDEEHRPSDYIEIMEKEPIIKVEVIGSACTPPGYVQLIAEPLDGFRRDDEVDDEMPVRFRINNLWGMHLRGDQVLVKDTEVVNFFTGKGYQEMPEEEFIRKYGPDLKGCKMKTDFREHPLTGMSCAIFSIPMSSKVRIMGGCEIPGWTDDNYPDDAHYSFRLIRVTVCDIIDG